MPSSPSRSRCRSRPLRCSGATSSGSSPAAALRASASAADRGAGLRRPAPRGDRVLNRDVNTALQLLTEMPDPQYVMVGDGYRMATYTWGDEGDPTVVVVHGFASSARDNWVNTGWV